MGQGDRGRMRPSFPPHKGLFAALSPTQTTHLLFHIFLLDLWHTAGLGLNHNQRGCSTTKPGGDVCKV